MTVLVTTSSAEGRGVATFFVTLCGVVVDTVVTSDANPTLELNTSKVRLWVLMRDQTLTHLSNDISLIPKHFLNHNVSLQLKTEIQGYQLVVIVLYYTFRENSNRAKK